MKFAQHAESNMRAMSDDYLKPDHYNFDQAQKDELQHLAGKYEFVEITDKELTELRNLTKNRLTFAEALETMLKSKLPGYKGMLYWGVLQELGLEAAEENEEGDFKEDSELLQNALTERERNGRVHIIDSIYCNGSTFYFWR